MARKKPCKPRTAKATPNGQVLPQQPPPAVEGLQSGAATPLQAVWWPWQNWLLGDSLNLLEGRKGCGKSSICAAVAAHFAGGPALPGTLPVSARSVLWCGAEESWSAAILPRLVAAGADLSWCHRLNLLTPEGKTRRLTLPSGQSDLADLLSAGRIALLLLDPFGSLADPEIDLRIEQHARRYLEGLAEILGQCRTTALLTRHLRKGAGGDPLDQGLGSVGVVNTCRTCWRADRHPTDDGRSCLSSVATNYSARPPSQLFRLEEWGNSSRVVWEGVSELSADILAEGRAGAADRDERKDACAVLRGILANGPRLAVSVYAEALACGVGPRTLRSAKTELGCTSERRAGQASGEAQWYWLPPAGGWPER